MKRHILVPLLLLAGTATTCISQPYYDHPVPFSMQLAGEISSPTSYLPQSFDVLHYDVELDLTAAPSQDVSGVCRIRIYWRDDNANGPFYFHLRDLHVDSAFYDGSRVDAVAKEDPSSPTYHYRIDPPSPPKQGDSATIRIVYSGSMTAEAGTSSWGGVQSSGGVLYAMGVGFHNNYVSATQHWLPCYDHPSDKATFRGRFRVKTGMAVASNGLLEIGAPEDGTVVYQWQTSLPTATYLLTFAVGAYVPLMFDGESAPMVVYSLPVDTAKTRRTFKMLPRMVSGFESRFGLYPFEKVGYVNTPKGAMEHQTMVSFPTLLSRRGDTLNSTGAHELAHQWFGDLVSPSDFRHAWLTESFATYCESVWMEELGGFAEYIKSQDGKLKNYLTSVVTRDGIIPLYDFPREQTSNYPETIYQKGAVVVGMLRHELGDSIFYPALRDYLQRFGYSIAATDDLRAVLEQHAGRSLGWFFDQWITGRGWPVVSLRTASQPQGENLQRVQINLSQIPRGTTTTFINLPVELGFKGSDGLVTYRIVEMDEATTTITLDSIADFSEITINRGPSLRTLLEVGTIANVDDVDMLPDSGNVEFVVRPNPLSGSVAALTVEVKGAADCSGIKYELFDSSGRRLLVGRTDTCEFTIPMAGFSSGAFVFRFSLNNTLYDVPVAITR